MVKELIKLSKRIKDIDIEKLNLKRFIDPKVPAWYNDSAVWRFLKQSYGLRFGGIVDDGEGPPLLIIESKYPR